MAAILDAAGIENNLFFLRLDNKKLRGVDPYDPKLTDEQKVERDNEEKELRDILKNADANLIVFDEFLF